MLTLGGERRAHPDHVPAGATSASGRPAPTRRSTRGGIRRSPPTRCYAGVAWTRLHPIGEHLVRRRAIRSIASVSTRAASSGCSARTCSPCAPSTTPPRRRCPTTSSGCSAARACAASKPGVFAGDKRFLWSAEVRVPFSSPFSVGRVGFNVFMDGGATAPYGERIQDQPRHKSAGAGLFLIATVLQLNFDVSRSIDGKSTRFHFGTGFTFCSIRGASALGLRLHARRGDPRQDDSRRDGFWYPALEWLRNRRADRRESTQRRPGGIPRLDARRVRLLHPHAADRGSRARLLSGLPARRRAPAHRRSRSR